MIPNTTRKELKKGFQRTIPLEKGVYPIKEWFNFNENGLRCLLCNEPVEARHKAPSGGWPSLILYVNGVRKIGATHPDCYLTHFHSIELNIKKDLDFYDEIKSGL